MDDVSVVQAEPISSYNLLTSIRSSRLTFIARGSEWVKDDITSHAVYYRPDVGHNGGPRKDAQDDSGWLI